MVSDQIDTQEQNSAFGKTAGYLFAIAAVAVAFLGRLALDRQWGDDMAYTLFFLAAIVCIIVTELGPALVSILAGFLLGSWFFAPPRHSLNPFLAGRLVMSGAYLGNLGIVLWFAVRAKDLLRKERQNLATLQARSAALEASEKRFQTLAEAAFEGILLSQNGKIIECNDQVGQLVGYKRDELLGRQATDFITPSQREPVLQNIREEKAAAYELELICRDGSRRLIEAHGRPMRNSAGESVRVSVIRDITEQKRWAETMRRRTEELERLMDTLPAAVWIAHDRECRMVTGNRSANELLGVKHGTNFGDAQAAQPTVRYYRTDGKEYGLDELPLQRAAATGRPVRSAEVELRFADGRRGWLLGSAEPLFDEGGVCRGAVSAFLDETERKAAEEELRTARDELARTNNGLERRVADRTRSLEEKTAELNSFCYTLAHDFRAPLRTQEGFARILVEEYGKQLGEEGATLAWRVLRAARRQSDIIQDLLAHISVTKSEMALEAVELKGAIEQASADLMLELQDKKAEIRDDTAASARVIADPSSLHLILLNLLTNAFKFVQPEKAPVVRLLTQRNGDLVRLSVEDNGIGISAEDIGKLFSMFKRLNGDAYPGTGMGLAIVKKAVERMGGRVGVESEPGRGSRFWLELKAA